MDSDVLKASMTQDKETVQQNLYEVFIWLTWSQMSLSDGEAAMLSPISYSIKTFIKRILIASNCIVNVQIKQAVVEGIICYKEFREIWML